MSGTITGMGQWMYFIHPPREDFAVTMSGLCRGELRGFRVALLRARDPVPEA